MRRRRAGGAPVCRCRMRSDASSRMTWWTSCWRGPERGDRRTGRYFVAVDQALVEPAMEVELTDHVGYERLRSRRVGRANCPGRCTSPGPGGDRPLMSGRPTPRRLGWSLWSRSKPASCPVFGCASSMPTRGRGRRAPGCSAAAGSAAQSLSAREIGRQLRHRAGSPRRRAAPALKPSVSRHVAGQRPQLPSTICPCTGAVAWSWGMFAVAATLPASSSSAPVDLSMSLTVRIARPRAQRSPAPRSDR